MININPSGKNTAIIYMAFSVVIIRGGIEAEIIPFDIDLKGRLGYVNVTSSKFMFDRNRPSFSLVLQWAVFKHMSLAGE